MLLLEWIFRVVFEKIAERKGILIATDKVIKNNGIFIKACGMLAYGRIFIKQHDGILVMRTLIIKFRVVHTVLGIGPCDRICLCCYFYGSYITATQEHQNGLLLS